MIPYVELLVLQIMFEGTRGRGYTGDIALDDVQFRKGSCQLNGFVKYENNGNVYIGVKNCTRWS